MDDQAKREAIGRSDLAHGLGDDYLDELARIARWRSIPAGGEIVREYDETFDLLLLIEGEGKVMTVTDEMITTIKAGMPIGEISFFDRRPRAAGVVATVDSVVLVLPEPELRSLTERFPAPSLKALNNLAKILCGRLRRANQQIAALLALEESREG